MMKVAERYIMRRVVAIFLTALLWVLAIVWTTQVLVRLNLVTSDGQSAATFFEIAALVLPAVVPIVIPFAIAIAVAQTLAAMNTDSELIVLTAAGSPRTLIIRPILLVAVLAAIAAFTVENFVEPHARERMRHMVTEARADLISTIIDEGSFHEVDDGLVLQIGERLPEGGLAGIFVSDTREDDIELIYYARRGTTARINEQQLLLMEDGTIQRRRANGDISSVRYQTYAFDLSEFAPASDGPTMFPKDRTIAYLMNPDADDRIFKSRPQMFRAELHRRFTDWSYAIVFALIGLAVAADPRSFRDARMHPLLTTMAVALLVRWAGFFVTNEAETRAGFVPLMYAVPGLTSLAMVWMISTNRSLEFPSTWSERTRDVIAGLHDRTASLRLGWPRLRGDRT